VLYVMLKMKHLFRLSAFLLLASQLLAEDPFAVSKENVADRSMDRTSKEFLSDKLLKAFGAKRLDNGTGGDKEHFLIRLTVLRSLDPPLMFTWYIKERGEESSLNIQRLAVTFSDEEGMKYGKVDFNKHIRIKPNQVDLLRSVYHSADISKLPQLDWQEAVLDGSRWIYEVAVHDESIILERNNPVNLNEITFESFKVSLMRKERESNLTSFALMLWLLSGLDEMPY